MSDSTPLLPVEEIVPSIWEIPRDDLREAVKEWRLARLAFFAVPPISINSLDRFPQEIWTRLGNAEHRLMQLAAALGE